MKNVLLALIRFYRTHISPHTPPACRFQPTFSQYAYTAIERFGALRGSWLALKRLLRATRFAGAATTPSPTSRIPH